MNSTYSNKLIEDLTLDIVREAIASIQVPEKVIERIELTPADYIEIKQKTVSSDIVPIYGIPVIVNKRLKKSRIIYKPVAQDTEAK